MPTLTPPLVWVPTGALVIVGVLLLAFCAYCLARQMGWIKRRRNG